MEFLQKEKCKHYVAAIFLSLVAAAIGDFIWFDGSFRFSAFISFIVILLPLSLLFTYWIRTEKTERSISNFELLFLISCFVFYTIWAIIKPFNYAPDEAMRYDVTKFLFENNHLPVGDELLSPWGFSYAHLPAVLCSQFGYVFMKLCAPLTTDGTHLLIAARMVSVVCGTVSVYFVIKITKLLFTSSARWVTIVIFAFMPQFAFLTSYVNNDSVALMGVTMIVYAWTLAMKYKWNYKNATLLCLGVAVCALSYYNTYAWILLSAFFFIITYFYQNPKQYKKFFKLTIYMVIVVLLLIGYNFMRHLVLYNDLLGIKTSHYYGELYAIDSLKPSVRMSFSEQGISLKSMLFDYDWIGISWQSFIGVFGCMNFPCPTFIYRAVDWILVIGFAGLVVKALSFARNKAHKLNPQHVTFYVCCLISAVITVMLSVYNSYNTDFQPQGRYCYPAFITLVLIVGLGYETFVKLIKDEKKQELMSGLICVGFSSLSAYAFCFVYLPS